MRDLFLLFCGVARIYGIHPSSLLQLQLKRKLRFAAVRSIATIDNLSAAYPIALRQVYFSVIKFCHSNKKFYRHYYE